MKLHRIETGKARIKKNQLAKSNAPFPKYAKVFFDTKWTEWLPIYVWVIEHEEGLIVVDTGETHKTGSKDYLPKWHPYYAFAVDFDVKIEEEVGPRLRSMGIDPNKDVKKVILTHLHTDHAGGLYHFPSSDIIINEDEYKTASGFSGIMLGYLPHRWPKWLDPTLIRLNNKPFGPFEKSLQLTEKGDVHVVYTPGHTLNHMSVIVRSGDVFYFLAGDTSYTEQLMLEATPDGVASLKSIDTLKKIQNFCRQYPTVYLPSHDPEAAQRMDHVEIVPLYEKAEVFTS